MRITKGKQYTWYINNQKDKIKSGLFTGDFDKNGNAILITKEEKTQSVPLQNLREVNK